MTVFDLRQGKTHLQRRQFRWKPVDVHCHDPWSPISGFPGACRNLSVMLPESPRRMGCTSYVCRAGVRRLDRSEKIARVEGLQRGDMFSGDNFQSGMKDLNPQGKSDYAKWTWDPMYSFSLLDAFGFWVDSYSEAAATSVLRPVAFWVAVVGREHWFDTDGVCS